MAVTKPSKFWADQLALIQEALQVVFAGGSLTVNGRKWGPGDLAEIETLEEKYRLKSAQQAILEGLQSYRIGGQWYTRADLNEINRRLDQIDARQARREAGGMRMRRGLPI